MSILGLGTATFIPGYGPGATAAAPGAALVQHAVERGIGYLDTASVYADAERIVGGAAVQLAARGTRLATKIAVEPGESPADVRRHADASIERLRTSRLDTLLIHYASARHLADAGLAAGLRLLRANGVAMKTGASTYGVENASVALQQDWCDVVQVEHSILNQSVLRAIGSRKGATQEIVARSVLCKGLLTGRRVHLSGPAKSIGDALDALDALAAAWNLSVPALAIRFALDTPGVDVVIVGVSSIAELDDALDAAAGAPLTAAQLSELAAFDRSQFDAVHPERWTNLAV